jgi:hypothetical protein
MQINLKQDEIAKAVKLFLKDQGIKTQGKYISIQFSMGKGLNGLKAEVNVEESDVPGFGQQDPENPDTPMEVLATVTEPEQPAPTPSSCRGSCSEDRGTSRVRYQPRSTGRDR